MTPQPQTQVRRSPSKPVMVRAADLEVLDLVADGLTNQEIGVRLGLSEDGVKNRLRRLTNQLGIHGRTALVGYAYKTNQLTARETATATPTLSRRLRQLLPELATGDSNERIARRMGLKVETVRTHLQRLYRTLGVETRAQAVRAGIDTGLITVVRRQSSAAQPRGPRR